MLPCFICGKDASTGWIKGFVPSPDSQKLALCREHDIPENRGKVIHEWFKLMKANYQTLATVEAQRGNRAATGGEGPSGTDPGLPRLMHIRFVVGGYMSLPCLKYEVTPNGTLEVETPEGRLQSFPLQHVKSYELSSSAAVPSAPYKASEAPAGDTEQAAEPDSSDSDSADSHFSEADENQVNESAAEQSRDSRAAGTEK